MRAGAERLLASVVTVFGAAQAHHGYLLTNARHTRIKLLVHDGAALTLTREQFYALVLGLPWLRLEDMRVITRL